MSPQLFYLITFRIEIKTVKIRFLSSFVIIASFVIVKWELVIHLGVVRWTPGHLDINSFQINMWRMTSIWIVFFGLKLLNFFFSLKIVYCVQKTWLFFKTKKKTLISINTYTKSEINTKKVQIYCFFFRLSSCNISRRSLDKIRIAGLLKRKS